MPKMLEVEEEVAMEEKMKMMKKDKNKQEKNWIDNSKLS